MAPYLTWNKLNTFKSKKWLKSFVTFYRLGYSNTKTHTMKKITFFTGAYIAFALIFMLNSSSVLAQSGTKLNDAEIASAAVVADQSDIDFAVIAKQKSKNAEVLKFAETMAKDHKQ